jgi:hypothetical protein
MAEYETTNTHDIRKLKPNEIDALGDRMLVRAVSRVFDAQPGLKSDMLFCVGCLRELAQDCPIDGLEIRVWRAEAL